MVLENGNVNLSVTAGSGHELMKIEGNIDGLKYGESNGMPAGVVRHHGGNRVELLNEGRLAGFINNMDALSAYRFAEASGATGIFKHCQPCGAAYGYADKKEEYNDSDNADNVSRNGGIVGTRHVTIASATRMVGRQGLYNLDIVVADTYEEGSPDILLSAKNPPLVYQVPEGFKIPSIDIQAGLEGPVFQKRLARLQKSDLVSVTGDIDDKMLDDIIFGCYVTAATPSNSITYIMPTETGAISIGNAGGVPSRVGASQNAMERAIEYLLFKYVRMPLDQIPEEINITMYMLSDGFFPDLAAVEIATPEEISAAMIHYAARPKITYGLRFNNFKKALERIGKEGHTIQSKAALIAPRFRINVPVIASPKGSKKDDLVAEFAEKRKLTLLSLERNGEPIRLFKHTPQWIFE